MGARENDPVYTVSEVTAQVKTVLETSLPSFWVEGEISNFVHHSSGHMYFTLKDAKSQLSSVMFKFRNARVGFTPENGMKVLAWGQIKVYEPAGRYQLMVDRMKPAGLGDLAARFEELKKKLREEGLFDQERKAPLPFLPRTVAVVTSPTGAAVRDVIRVVRKRLPSTRIVVVPTPVQGRDAAPGIVGAIRLLDEWGEADVAVVGRGGGSLEDLWAFNEEEVARAIAGAATPIISAVGHEVDFTIADFVADYRAATPSHAGERVVPSRAELIRVVGSLETRLTNAARSTLARLADRVAQTRRAYAFRLPRQLTERLAQRIDDMTRRLEGSMSTRIGTLASRLERFGAELKLSDPSHILARGFAAVSLLPDLVPVRSVCDVAEGDGFRLTVSDGSIDGKVVGVTPSTRRKK
jgi:exodeoxyribonuclease VII large subunit